MKCKRDECLNLLPRPHTKELEKLKQTEWGVKGYCSESCMKTHEDHLICDNCNSDIVYDPENDQYTCPKCDYKIQNPTVVIG